jgi:hypothetical protein
VPQAIGGRHYAGEVEAAQLISWLNTTKQEDVTRKVTQVIRAIQAMRERGGVDKFQMLPRLATYSAGRGGCHSCCTLRTLADPDGS